MTAEEYSAVVDGITPDERGCLNWPRAFFTNGYPAIYWEGRNQKGNRIALSLKLGRPIAPGLKSLHTCDNTKCVNPEHLYEGTTKQNAEDAKARGRLCCGDRHHARARPEIVPRGQNHYTVTNPEKRVRGSKHGSSKISESDVVEIRRLVAAEQLTQQEVGEMYGIKQVTVSSICNRRSWRHVP